jgi:hypothetical protein
MASVQYETVVPTANAPIDKTPERGVYFIGAARIHVTPVLAEIARMMREIRSTGKCGMMVVRWDGNRAWSLHMCDPPARVNE